MKKALLLAAASLLISATSFANPELTVDDELKNPIVIKGGKLTPEVIDNNKVIMPSNLPYTVEPDSEFTFYYPDSSGFVGFDKACLTSIFPNAATFEVNGKEVSRDEFYATPNKLISTITGQGNKLSATTYEEAGNPNPALTEMSDKSVEWYKSTFGTVPLPESLVINDPSTLPANGFLNLDFVMITPEGLAQRKLPEGAIAGYMVTLFGTYAEMNLLTDPNSLNYFGAPDQLQIPASELESLSIGSITKALKIDPARIMMIKFDGTTVTLLPLPAFH